MVPVPAPVPEEPVLAQEPALVAAVEELALEQVPEWAELGEQAPARESAVARREPARAWAQPESVPPALGSALEAAALVSEMATLALAMATTPLAFPA